MMNQSTIDYSIYNPAIPPSKLTWGGRGGRNPQAIEDIALHVIKDTYLWLLTQKEALKNANPSLHYLCSHIWSTYPDGSLKNHGKIEDWVEVFDRELQIRSKLLVSELKAKRKGMMTESETVTAKKAELQQQIEKLDPTQ